MKYILDISGNNCTATQFIRVDGSKGFLHNVISFEFNDKLEPISGWHIGTEDFTFRGKKKSEEVINYYNPGLLEQFKEEYSK